MAYPVIERTRLEVALASGVMQKKPASPYAKSKANNLFGKLKVEEMP
jgi:ATP-dependent DNA ligase